MKKSILIGMMLIFACSTTAQAGWKDVFRKAGIGGDSDEKAIEEAGFDYSDERAIRRYYAKERKKKNKGRRGMPPGLAKKPDSHPGKRNWLRKGGKLPEHIQGEDLPADLEEVLDVLPEGVTRKRVENAIVLVNKARKVIDIIKDIE